MTDTVLYSQPGFRVTRVPTREARISILRLDIETHPSADEFESAMKKVHKFFDLCTGRIVTCAHVRCADTPDMAQVASVVRHLVELQTAMDAKLKGTVIDLGSRSASVDVSIALFRKMWAPTSERAKRRVFKVVASTDEANAILEDILAHEAKKRARREAKEKNTTVS